MYTSSTQEEKPQTFKQRLVEIACKQLETATRFQKSRFDQIRKNEELLLGKEQLALRGRSNVPFDTVIANGFVETLLSKTDEPVRIAFGETREQDKKDAMKMTAVWERESAQDKADWDGATLESKKLAAASGRAILKFYAENDPKFRTCLEVVDHFDFYCEPQGGRNLDKHRFKGQINIFRSKADILAGIESGWYDKEARLMLVKTESNVTKKNRDDFQNKAARFQAMGMNILTEDYVGEDLYNLAEHVMELNGKWYHIIFDPMTKVCLRCVPLEQDFAHAVDYPGRGPWVSWATHVEPFIFWSRSPIDDIRPIAYAMKKVMNYALDNLEKRNWDMKAYDPTMFPDPTALNFRQDGLARASIPAGSNKRIEEGIYQFQTPDTTSITVNVVEYLNRFLGEKTGITPDAQGNSNEDKVGIYFGNMQNVADRIGLNNKMYKQAYIDLGVMFDYGTWEHLREPYAIKLIGIKGVEWDATLDRKSASKDFNIIITAGGDEEKVNEMQNQRKEATLARLEKDPELRKGVNQKWYLREVLSYGGFNDEQVRQALDTENEGNWEIMAEAAEAIEMVLTNSGTPKLNRGATTGFVRKILDFIRDNDIDVKKRNFLKKYADAHIKIARDNAMSKAILTLATKGISPMEAKARLAGMAPRPQMDPRIASVIGRGAPQPAQQMISGPVAGNPQEQPISNPVEAML